MLVIGCTVSLMSWGRGCCTQPTPWECCSAPSSASVELGTAGRWEAPVTGQGVLHTVCCHWGWAEQQGWHSGDTRVLHHLSQAVTETSVLWSAVLTEQGCALQTPQGCKMLVSGTKLLIIHTASCRLTWHGTGSSGRAILLSEELSQPPSAVLEELDSVKMQCRTSCSKFLKMPIGTY